MEYLAHNPTAPDISMATTELILSIQRGFPQARIEPRPPYDDEEICLDVRLPGTREELTAARRRIIELEIEIQDKYRVYTIVMVSPQ